MQDTLRKLSAGCPLLYAVTLKALRREQCILARDQTLERLGQTNLPHTALIEYPEGEIRRGAWDIHPPPTFWFGLYPLMITNGAA
jgi:hypothetical protein